MAVESYGPYDVGMHTNVMVETTAACHLGASINGPSMPVLH